MVHISNKKAAKQQLNMENQKIEGSTEQVTWMLNTVHLAWHILFSCGRFVLGLGGGYFQKIATNLARQDRATQIYRYR